jgi:putative transposase
MPDHVHLLLKHENDLASLETILTGLKSRSSRRILAHYGQLQPASNAVHEALASRRLWEPGGGHDRSIYSGSEFEQKLSYILMNPVKAGLSLTPEEYPWCSLGSHVLPGDPWWD